MVASSDGDGGGGPVVDLVLDGVDTVATVTLNGGAATADCASAHAPCVLRGVQGVLRRSGNVLEVAFAPAEAEAAARAAAYPYKVPFVKVREERDRRERGSGLV